MQQILTTLPFHHLLLRLPFLRGGYQFVFLPVAAYLFLFINKYAAAKKILCYSVLKPKQPSSRKLQAAKRILCYSVLKPNHQSNKQQKSRISATASDTGWGFFTGCTCATPCVPSCPRALQRCLYSSCRCSWPVAAAWSRFRPCRKPTS